MSRLTLSNIQLRSNLLSEEYQREMSRVTVFEFKDIRRRCPYLTPPETMTEMQREQWRQHLFDGEGSVSMDDDERRRAWLERLAENVVGALASLEERPEVEQAFEILCVAEQLADPAMGSLYAAHAAGWRDRARAVLARDEFRPLTPDMINGRLGIILGRSLPETLDKPGGTTTTAALSERSASLTSTVARIGG
jgi:hypothetical protein